jgi:hypothetical protein
LSGNISGTDPLKDNRLHLKAEPLDGSEEAKNTAAVVNELSKEITCILVSHPINAKRAAEGKNIANVVLLRGCGIRIEVSAKDLILPPSRDNSYLQLWSSNMKDLVSIDFSPMQCLLEFCMSDMLLPKISFQICRVFPCQILILPKLPFL